MGDGDCLLLVGDDEMQERDWEHLNSFVYKTVDRPLCMARERVDGGRVTLGNVPGTMSNRIGDSTNFPRVGSSNFLLVVNIFVPFFAKTLENQTTPCRKKHACAQYNHSILCSS